MFSKSLKTISMLVAILGLSMEFVLAEVNSVHVSSRLDPNAIIITELDIIFVYDAETAAAIPATKSQWYSGKRQFTRDAGDAIDIVNIFMPQGFDSEVARLPQRKARAVRVLLFVQHDDSKAAPLDITDWIDVRVEIDPFGMLVSKVN